MKICPHCDCENKKSECFCTNCGRPVQSPKPPVIAIGDRSQADRVKDSVTFRGLGDLGKL